jgi:hypothetical protein
LFLLATYTSLSMQGIPFSNSFAAFLFKNKLQIISHQDNHYM